MIYFVEFKLFLPHNLSPVHSLRKQMERSLNERISWVEWIRGCSEPLAPRPDVLLVNGSRRANLDVVSYLQQRTDARIVALFGCPEGTLGMPVVRNEYDMNALTRYLPEYSEKIWLQTGERVLKGASEEPVVFQGERRRKTSVVSGWTRRFMGLLSTARSPEPEDSLMSA